MLQTRGIQELGDETLHPGVGRGRCQGVMQVARAALGLGPVAYEVDVRLERRQVAPQVVRHDRNQVLGYRQSRPLLHISHRALLARPCASPIVLGSRRVIRKRQRANVIRPPAQRASGRPQSPASTRLASRFNPGIKPLHQPGLFLSPPRLKSVSNETRRRRE